MATHDIERTTVLLDEELGGNPLNTAGGNNSSVMLSIVKDLSQQKREEISGLKLLCIMR